MGVLAGKLTSAILLVLPSERGMALQTELLGGSPSADSPQMQPQGAQQTVSSPVSPPPIFVESPTPYDLESIAALIDGGFDETIEDKLSGAGYTARAAQSDLPNIRIIPVPMYNPEMLALLACQSRVDEQFIKSRWTGVDWSQYPCPDLSDDDDFEDDLAIGDTRRTPSSRSDESLFKAEAEGTGRAERVETSSNKVLEDEDNDAESSNETKGPDKTYLYTAPGISHLTDSTTSTSSTSTTKSDRCWRPTTSPKSTRLAESPPEDDDDDDDDDDADDAHTTQQAVKDETTSEKKTEEIIKQEEEEDDKNGENESGEVKDKAPVSKKKKPKRDSPKPPADTRSGDQPLTDSSEDSITTTASPSKSKKKKSASTTTTTTSRGRPGIVSPQGVEEEDDEDDETPATEYDDDEEEEKDEDLTTTTTTHKKLRSKKGKDDGSKDAGSNKGDDISKKGKDDETSKKGKGDSETSKRDGVSKKGKKIKTTTASPDDDDDDDDEDTSTMDEDSDDDNDDDDDDDEEDDDITAEDEEAAPLPAPPKKRKSKPSPAARTTTTPRPRIRRVTTPTPPRRDSSDDDFDDNDEDEEDIAEESEDERDERLKRRRQQQMLFYHRHQDRVHSRAGAFLKRVDDDGKTDECECAASGDMPPITLSPDAGASVSSAALLWAVGVIGALVGGATAAAAMAGAASASRARRRQCSSGDSSSSDSAAGSPKLQIKRQCTHHVRTSSCPIEQNQDRPRQFCPASRTTSVGSGDNGALLQMRSSEAATGLNRCQPLQQAPSCPPNQCQVPTSLADRCAMHRKCMASLRWIPSEPCLRPCKSAVRCNRRPPGEPQVTSPCRQPSQRTPSPCHDRQSPCCHQSPNRRRQLSFSPTRRPPLCPSSPRPHKLHLKCPLPPQPVLPSPKCTLRPPQPTLKHPAMVNACVPPRQTICSKPRQVMPCDSEGCPLLGNRLRQIKSECRRRTNQIDLCLLRRRTPRTNTNRPRHLCDTLRSTKTGRRFHLKPSLSKQFLHGRPSAPAECGGPVQHANDCQFRLSPAPKESEPQEVMDGSGCLMGSTAGNDRLSLEARPSNSTPHALERSSSRLLYRSSPRCPKLSNTLGSSRRLMTSSHRLHVHQRRLELLSRMSSTSSVTSPHSSHFLDDMNQALFTPSGLTGTSHGLFSGRNGNKDETPPGFSRSNRRSGTNTFRFSDNCDDDDDVEEEEEGEEEEEEEEVALTAELNEEETSTLRTSQPTQETLRPRMSSPSSTCMVRSQQESHRRLESEYPTVASQQPQVTQSPTASPPAAQESSSPGEEAKEQELKLRVREIVSRIQSAEKRNQMPAAQEERRRTAPAQLDGIRRMPFIDPSERPAPPPPEKPPLECADEYPAVKPGKTRMS
eukprot:Blabericola_migrator_1__4571@NODE_242_length_10949_cov_37_670281_g204_i0_p1_GENE_NODE_242_length_10949_cov_37_670281_g204_i0NODE_242_length_10949_cov_37_670281_g204_i0_p1_ORF_typecomplete_len1376_score292_34Sporozoite_P67/PF05642_11/0_029_NODE_242_length_10949_cov_37_670281_g204_i057299856